MVRLNNKLGFNLVKKIVTIRDIRSLFVIGCSFAKAPADKGEDVLSEFPIQTLEFRPQ